MEDILKTTLLEFEKSAFIIDLVKHSSGKQYIRILQTIQDEESDKNRAIKINPSLLSDILTVLNSYQELVSYGNTTKESTAISKVHTRTPTEFQKSAIQKYYLKGVSISDLTIQFNCKKELIEQVLNNSGITIVNHKLSEPFHYKKFNRRTK